MSHTDVYLDVKGLAARYPGVTPSTVHTWLYKGTAPQSIKLGKRRLFKLADVVAWEKQHAEGGSGNDAAAWADDQVIGRPISAP